VKRFRFRKAQPGSGKRAKEDREDSEDFEVKSAEEDDASVGDEGGDEGTSSGSIEDSSVLAPTVAGFFQRALLGGPAPLLSPTPTPPLGSKRLRRRAQQLRVAARRTANRRAAAESLALALAASPGFLQAAAGPAATLAATATATAGPVDEWLAAAEAASLWADAANQKVGPRRPTGSVGVGVASSAAFLSLQDTAAGPAATRTAARSRPPGASASASALCPAAALLAHALAVAEAALARWEGPPLDALPPPPPRPARKALGALHVESTDLSAWWVAPSESVGLFKSTTQGFNLGEREGFLPSTALGDDRKRGQ
jgi:hypothetical protein